MMYSSDPSEDGDGDTGGKDIHSDNGKKKVSHSLELQQTTSSPEQGSRLHRDSGIGESMTTTPHFQLGGEGYEADLTFTFSDEDRATNVYDLAGDSDAQIAENLPSQLRQLGLGTPPIDIPSRGRAKERGYHEQRHTHHTPPRAYMVPSSSSPTLHVQGQQHPRFSTGSLPPNVQALLTQAAAARAAREHSTGCELVENAIKLQNAKLDHTESHLMARGRVARKSESECCTSGTTLEANLIRARREHRSMSTPCMPREHVELMFGRELRKIADEFHCTARGMGELFSGPGSQHDPNVPHASSFPGTSHRPRGMWQHIIQFISPKRSRRGSHSSSQTGSRPSSMVLPDVVLEQEDESSSSGDEL